MKQLDPVTCASSLNNAKGLSELIKALLDTMARCRQQQHVDNVGGSSIGNGDQCRIEGAPPALPQHRWVNASDDGDDTYDMVRGGLVNMASARIVGWTSFTQAGAPIREFELHT